MASTYLSKTFGQAGNRRTFTISYWIKMGIVSTGADQAIMGAAQDGSNSDDLYIHTGRLNFSGYYGSTQYQVRTTAKYVDTFGWYHHVIRFDTTQSTASDRVRLYVNGELITNLANNTYPSQNFQTTYFNTARLHTIGSFAIGSLPNTPFDGSMSHFHFCDGYSYGADSFGSTDATTGEWKINTSPNVQYGTNGFFILKNGNSVTDQSGQGNNWTVAGGTLTKTEDCPSNVFATFNPFHFGDANPSSYGAFSNGNTRYASTQGGSPYPYSCSTLAASSGKWYAEFKITQVSNSMMVGITDGNKYQYLGNTNDKDVALFYDGNKYPGGSSYGNAFSDNDIVGVAMDLDNMKVYFSKNGTWQNSGDPTSGSTGTGAIDIPTGGLGQFHFSFGDSGGNTTSCSANFGNGYFGTTAVSRAGNNASNLGIFEYDVPSGYTALCTKGLNE